MKKAVVILAHGSKKEEAKNDLLQITNALVKRTGLTIRLACMQLAEPSFKQTIDELAGGNYSHILVIPFFLTNGAHMQEDIPELIKETKQRNPQIQIRTTGYLWPDSSMIDLLEKRIKQSLLPQGEKIKVRGDPLTPTLSPKGRGSIIEQQSFAIIDDLITRNDLSQDELAVVKRLIHTSGDTSLANLITFTDNAIANGIEAIKEGLPIITDVSMVQAGINKGLTNRFSIQIEQLIADEEVKEEAARLYKTRARVAIRKLALRCPQSIIAIGNAPTALLEVAELIASGAIHPALVIAMPVGFVGTVQSKEAIKKTSAEYICVEGTRGGSNLAAAAVNALLKTASVNKKCSGGLQASAEQLANFSSHLMET